MAARLKLGGAPDLGSAWQCVRADCTCPRPTMIPPANDPSLDDEIPVFAIGAPAVTSRSPYRNIYDRLVQSTWLYDGQPFFGDTREEDRSPNACWIWTQRVRPKDGYPLVTLYIPAAHKNVTFSAHVVMLLLMQEGTDISPNRLFAAYTNFRKSGLEVDHMCDRDHRLMRSDSPVSESCLNPDHLRAVRPAVNIFLRDFRRARKPSLDFDDADTPEELGEKKAHQPTIKKDRPGKPVATAPQAGLDF
jgi:hypothetical protein